MNKDLKKAMRQLTEMLLLLFLILKKYHDSEQSCGLQDTAFSQSLQRFRKVSMCGGKSFVL